MTALHAYAGFVPSFQGVDGSLPVVGSRGNVLPRPAGDASPRIPGPSSSPDRPALTTRSPAVASRAGRGAS